MWKDTRSVVGSDGFREAIGRFRQIDPRNPMTRKAPLAGTQALPVLTPSSRRKRDCYRTSNTLDTFLTSLSGNIGK